MRRPWLHVTEAERVLRNVGQARALFKRGCNTVQGKALAPFAQRWVEFERREGDVETYAAALARCAEIAGGAPVSSDGVPGKVGRARKERAREEDVEKQRRREEVMKKWAERKAKAAAAEKPAGEKAGKRKRGDEGGGAVPAGGAEKRLKTESGEVASAGPIGTAPPPEASEGGKPVVHVANLGAADEAAVVALLAGVAPSLSADKVRVVRDKFGNSKVPPPPPPPPSPY